MDKAWLQEALQSGRSIESIAREVGKDPSTVAYWVSKHGLESQHAARHTAKGGISREVLEPLIEQRVPLRQIADRLGVSYTAVRYWVNRYGLTTARTRKMASTAEARVGDFIEGLLTCPQHGESRHVRDAAGYVRCTRCRQEAVAQRRRRLKEILVAEAGGGCRLCGFSDYLGALQFHHVEPELKEFALGESGLTRSLERVRAEAAKCVLLCANCHAAVEAGRKRLPLRTGLGSTPG